MKDGLPVGWRQRIKAWAGSKERIHELHLFGSRAKGDFDAESDVDLAYVLTGGDPGEVLSYSMPECDAWERELQEILAVRVQLQVADPKTDAIVWPSVREHGQLLYRKTGYSPAG